jgi:Cu2+-exporting ATPase
MTSALDCFHCGEPVPKGVNLTVEIDLIKQPMCCIGCQSVAQAIVDAGAGAFYQQRSTTGIEFERLEALKPWADMLGEADWVERHVRPVSATDSLVETTLAIEGLRCGACAWLIEKALGQVPGVHRVRANASTERLMIQWNPTTVSLAQIAQRISAIGYAVLPISSAPLEERRRQEDRTALRRLFVAGLSAAQIMMYAYPEYLEGDSLDNDIRTLMRTASMAITVPVMVYSATPFFDSARRAIAQGRINMDVPVSLGLWIAFISSMLAWWAGTGEVYFDSVSMFVFLLLGGRWIERRVRAKASAQRERIATALPALAQRISAPTGIVPAWRLIPGDRICVKSGERIPADGLLESAETDIDASWINGEALPRRIRAGQRLPEGAINLGPEIMMQVEVRVSEGTLARLSQLAEAAAADRPQWIEWADQLGARFTAAILVISVLLTLIFIMNGATTTVWLPALISVLVVTCPCALSLAGPTAYAAALAKLLERGVAVSNATSLERLLNVTDVVFDKTGTLTDPATSRVDMVFGAPQDQEIACGLAKSSTHPLALAMSRMPLPTSTEQPIMTQITQHAGLGISGRLRGREVRLGSLHFANMHEASIHANRYDACNVFLSIDGSIRAGFLITDTPRPDAQGLIRQLQQQGKRIWCASGDRRNRVDKLAVALGLEQSHAFAEQTPAMKQSFVAKRQSEGAIVAMIGDGHNDAPVLAQADVSIAMQGAAPLAQQKADIYCLTPGLGGVVLAMDTARKSRIILRQNLSWAVLYNIVAIPFAASGLITPLIASIGMAASSLLVVLNSSRLLR